MRDLNRPVGIESERSGRQRRGEVTKDQNQQERHGATAKHIHDRTKSLPRSFRNMRILPRKDLARAARVLASSDARDMTQDVKDGARELNLRVLGGVNAGRVRKGRCHASSVAQSRSWNAVTMR
jgi:hypothetical protein